MRINYVEDETNLAEIITKYLNLEGFKVKNYYKGEDALKDINEPCDLWILDIMLKGDISGYDLIKKIKENDPYSLVIFTSARDQDLDKIIGLELGSDDYIAKPFSPKELILRVKAVLRRKKERNNDNNLIKYETYLISINNREVKEDSSTIDLTSREFDLLILFLKNKGVAFDREKILEDIWGSNYFGSDRVVDDLMRRLRQKMPKLKIETIYGFGYKLL